MTVASLGAILMGLGVMLGAMAAHALKTRLSPEMLLVFETGARYHIYHALGLLLFAAFMQHGVSLVGPSYMMLAGVLLFSGSLYALALSGVRALGMLTPLGGIAFMSAWAWAAFIFWRGR